MLDRPSVTSKGEIVVNLLHVIRSVAIGWVWAIFANATLATTGRRISRACSTYVTPSLPFFQQ